MPTAFTHDPNMGVPSSTTDTAVVRWSGTTGGTILSSGVTIDNSNVMAGITSLTVDNLNLNGNTISSTAGTDLFITPLGGQQLILDGTIIIDAGVVTGATSITATEFHGGGGNLTGISAGAALTGSTALTIVTVTGANAMKGESTITYEVGEGGGNTNILELDNAVAANNAHSRIRIQSTQGDPVLEWRAADTQSYSLGIDNTDSDNLYLMTDSQPGQTAGNIVMKITSDAEVTMPNQPAFGGLLGDTTNYNSTGNGSERTLTSWTELYDIGSNFTNGPGYFTAPVDGHYWVYCKTVLGGLTTSHTSSKFMIVTSNRTWSEWNTNVGATRDSNYNNIMIVSALVDMDAGDELRIKGNIYGGGQTVDFLADSSGPLATYLNIRLMQ